MPEPDTTHYPPIADYALIGDCRAAGLVSRDGSLDWLCLPRLDSPSIFSALLDAEGGGRFRIRPTAPFQPERRYVPGTNILETTFRTAAGVVVPRDLMPVASEDEKRRALTRLRTFSPRPGSDLQGCVHYGVDMPMVLVHGNPETAAIWDDLRAHLGQDDLVALSPPGFGAPVPAGFGATADEYVAWLTAELERLEPPIDLVGHDWGGGHVCRAVAARPDLVRSWASDIAGCFDPEYVWHERAQVWQTPGAGEAAIQEQLAVPTTRRVAFFEGLGLSRAAAEQIVAGFTPEMGRCILALYRSAAQPRMAEWGAALGPLRSCPGLVIIPTEDHYTGGEALARRTAERVGARVAVLSGLGHWWMCQDPRRGADTLRAFVDSLDC